MADLNYSSFNNWFKYRHLVLLETLARTKNMHLAAEQMNLSQPAISKMLKEIENMLGFSIFERFARAVEDIPEIESCYSLSGDFDTMIKVRVKDMKAYQAFMSGRLGTLPGVIQTRSEFVIEEHKTSFGINPELLSTL